MNDQVATPVSRRAVLAGAGAVATSAALASSTTETWARPGPPRRPGPPGDVLTTLFTDDCTNLAAAGWVGDEPLIGAYITDHARSLGNPPEVPLLPVDDGNYLFYSDILATHHDSPYSIRKSLPISGASWLLRFRARIDELMVSRDTYSTVRPRGFVMRVTAADVVGTTRRYQLRIHDTNKITCLMASGAEQTVEFTNSDPSAPHDWEVYFDGLDSLAVHRDGSRIADFVGVGQVLAASGTGIELAVNGYDSVSGANRVYLDMIELNVTTPTVVVDPANDLDEHWTVTPATADAYIADSTGPGGGIDAPEIAPGEYLLHAGAGAASMHTPATLSQTAWTVEFAARFAAMPTSNPGASDQGLVLTLNGFNRTYQVVWAAAGALSLLDASGTAHSYDLPTPDPESYSVWRIGTDSTGRTAVSANGVKVAVLDDAGTPGAGGSDPGLTLTVDASDSSDGQAEVHLTYVKLVEGPAVEWFRPAITGVTVLPTSDAAQLDTAVSLHDVDPRWLADGSLSLTWDLHADGELIRTETRPVTASHVPIAVTAVGASGELVCRASLRRGQSQVATAEQKLWLPESMSLLSPGDAAQGGSGSYLFNALDQAADSTGSTAAQAGWLVSDYTWDGDQTGGVFIESSASAAPLIIPAALAGWCAISVGCLSGSEAVSVRIAGQSTTVTTSTSADPDSYGPGAIAESYLGVFDLTAADIVVEPVAGKASRVAYLRFRSLTADEVTRAQQPDEGAAGTRLMIDNDGYSEYAYRAVTDEAKLRARVVGFSGKDVGAIAYCLLGTTLTNYNSAVSVGPRESKEWMTPELWSGLLATDRTVIDRLIGINDAGVVPHAAVADECDSHGMDTFASLRAMSTKSPTYRAGLNGKKYADLYPDYAQENFDGSTSFRLSYAYPELRSYILDLLVEAGSFPKVDGVMVDFCRYPKVIGWEPPLVSAYQQKYGLDPRLETTVEGIGRWLAFRCDPVTTLLRQVRAGLPDSKVMVRVPRNWYFDYGLDVQTWVAEGLIDIVVPSTDTREDFWTNEIDDWVDLVRETPVALYGCIEATLVGRDATPVEDELAERGIPVGTVSRRTVDAVGYQLRAHEFYEAGFDGVYLFNNPWGRDSVGLLGDKIKVSKWRTFGYPVTWATNLVTSTPR